MTIGSIGSSSNVYSINSILANQTGGASAATDSGGPPPQVSDRAKWMSELQDLQKSDPDKFKQVTSEISDKLKQEASSATGQQADLLNSLADKFSQASQSGDMSSLQPPGAQGAQGHQGHHHHVKKYAEAQQQQGASGNDPSQLFAQIDQTIEAALQE